MQINLIDLMPVGRNGAKELLPKQAHFFTLATTPPKNLDELPHYIAYVGGVGSGKTKIGNLTMLAMALQESGDYLICRQFMPELRRTTYKEFLEMIPKPLIVEHKVAEAVIKIKAVNGVSSIYFAPLEDPEKFRSMTLNAFYIDECNQVSEEAFTILQGRLRGRAWRKGLLTSNPSGHDWVYRWFYKKDSMTPEAKPYFTLIRAPTTENIHLSDGYVRGMIATWSKDRIEREIMGSFDAFEGAVYEEFRRDIHVIKPFVIPQHWKRLIGIDHGYRNPSAWIWAAIGEDGEVYVYREFYQKEWLISEIVKGSKKDFKHGVLALMGDEKIDQAFIDPSTKARRGTNGESDYDEYIRCLPPQFPLYPARNAVELGIDRVKSYLKIHETLKKPRLYIFDTCINLIEEMVQYRYQELKPGQESKKAEFERPLKANDHALDALRYIIITLPDPTPKEEAKKLPYGSLEWRLSQEIGNLNKPKSKTPF